MLYKSANELLSSIRDKKISSVELLEALLRRIDNINSEMYNDSIEGLLPRKKIRIRQYPNDDDKKFYLEIKNSSVEGRFKTRKIINKEKADYFEKVGLLDNQ